MSEPDLSNFPPRPIEQRWANLSTKQHQETHIEKGWRSDRKAWEKHKSQKPYEPHIYIVKTIDNEFLQKI